MMKQVMGSALVALGLLWSSVGEADLNQWDISATVLGQDPVTIRLPARGDTRFTIGHWTCLVPAERVIAGLTRRAVNCVNPDEYMVQIWLACGVGAPTSFSGVGFGPVRGVSQSIHIGCVR